MDMLDKLDGSECHGELFLPQPVETTPVAGSSDYMRYIERKRKHCFGLRPFSVFSYLNGLYRREGSVGFRLMYSQLLKYPEILIYLVARRIRVIHLVRENPLDIIISSKVAARRGRWHDTTEQSASKQTQVHLDPKETVARIKDLEKNVRFMDRLLGVVPIPSTRITYEKLMDEPDRFGSLARFLSLGSSGTPPQTNLVKRKRRAHNESIENYDEIELSLRASGYARFL
jgi:hypothetical protein